MVISHVDCPAPRAEWTTIAAGDNTALIEHMPAWLDVVCAGSRARDASRLYRFDDGRRFVLPLVQRLTRFGPQTGFSPGWGIGGLVGADLDSDAVSAVVADLARSHVVSTHVRPNPLQADAWIAAHTSPAQAIAKRAHVVDLKGGLDAVEGLLRKSGRRGIKKADKAGVEVSMHHGSDMLDVYYERLYRPSIERWAVRQHEPVALARFRASRRDSLDKLLAMGSTLGSSLRLYLASIDGVPAAGNLVLWGPQNAHATRGAMDYALAGPTSANYAIEWAAIRDACTAGFSSYQMGESGGNDSLASYKQRFGAVAIDYHEYRLERLPVRAVDTALRRVAKRIIGFQDT